MTRFKSTFRLALPLAMLLTTAAISLVPTSAKAWEPNWSNGTVTSHLVRARFGRADEVCRHDRKGWQIRGLFRTRRHRRSLREGRPQQSKPGRQLLQGYGKAGLRRAAQGARARKYQRPPSEPRELPARKIYRRRGQRIRAALESGRRRRQGHWTQRQGQQGRRPYGQAVKNINEKINAAAHEARLIGESMGDGTEGGGESAPTLTKHGQWQQHGGKGGGNGDGEGDGSDKNSDKEKLPKGEYLRPRPDLINPTPELKGHGAAAVKTRPRYREHQEQDRQQNRENIGRDVARSARRWRRLFGLRSVRHGRSA